MPDEPTYWIANDGSGLYLCTQRPAIRDTGGIDEECVTAYWPYHYIVEFQVMPGECRPLFLGECENILSDEKDADA